METFARDLKAAFGLREKEHVAIVGAGGKTSLMFALARERVLAGSTVLMSTTTKTWQKEANRAPLLIFTLSDSVWHEKLAEGLKKYKYVFLARDSLASGKVQGVSSLEADKLYQRAPADYLILEADGAAGRPLKAPAIHEPVIPSSATLVVAMMGLEAMGKKLDPHIVFRMDRFEVLTGLVAGLKLTPEDLFKVFCLPDGLFKGTPRLARRVAFLNKLDLLSDYQNARKLADLLIREPKANIERVIVGSLHHGEYLISRKKP